METINHTLVTEFVLQGLSSDPLIQTIIFVVSLLSYSCIIFGNIFILTAIKVNRQLHTPMYFFLGNLSLLDLCFSSTCIPKALENIMSETKTISFVGCATQMYISLSLGEAECILLSVMAYDRYLAICYPLRYMAIMNRKVCIKLGIGIWICGFVLSSLHVAITLKVPICGSNRINHAGCEIPAVLRLACTDITFFEIVIIVVAVLILILPISLILVSYIRIIVSILKIRTATGRYKAFSTCTSHILVVVLFFATAMYVYMKPQSNHTQSTDKIVTMAYTTITPLMNPIIYSLRNQEVQTALKKTIHIICSRKQYNNFLSIDRCKILVTREIQLEGIVH